ncbi:MAG: hypothetical protein JNL58_12475 [Planctomyces sp.]|nr:hypothetical protein [Planctomyces sp.]
MRGLCLDICERHAAFGHVRMSEVAVTYAQTRSPVEWGMQAKLTPLRFEGGRRTMTRRGRKWTVERVFQHGQELLYLLTFYLPRYQNLSFEEKLITVFHELYHISPRFDGDIRRFGGSCYMHTGSQKKYDELMKQFAMEYLKMGVSEELLRFLRLSFGELTRTCGTVVGVKVNVPRLIPMDEAA